MDAALSHEESSRLEALRRYRILHSAPEQAFDDISLLAARLLNAPIAYLGFVDETRIYLRARVGVATPEIPREGSFESQAIRESDPFVIRDASEDARFTGSKARFYAAARLVTVEGQAIGVLAVMDRLPRDVTPDQGKALTALARLAMTHLDLHHKLQSCEIQLAQQPEPDERNLAMALCYADGMMEVALGPLLVLDGDLTIVKGNPPFYDTVGRAPDDVDKRFVGDILPDSTFETLLREVNETGVPRRGFEMDLAGKPLRVNAAKLRFEGGGIPLVVVAFDRRRAGGAAPDSGALSALGQVEEPAGRIASFTQLLSMRYGDKLEPDARRWLEEIVYGSFRIQEVLRTFAGKAVSPPPPAPPPRSSSAPTPTAMRINSDAILNQVLKGLKTSLDSSGGKVTRDPLPAVGGKSEDLQEVFENLIQNAIRYRSRKPPQIHVWAELEDDRWTFAISDNGVGIDPARSASVFNGPGRGLPFCREIVERHGGKIWLTSSPGDGATFFFSWPK